MAGIIWLASYPKSGNTWLRAFLTSFQSGGQPVDINSMAGGPIASARKRFDDAMGVEASELTQEEIDRYRPRILEANYLYRCVQILSEYERYLSDLVNKSKRLLPSDMDLFEQKVLMRDYEVA